MLPKPVTLIIPSLVIPPVTAPIVQPPPIFNVAVLLLVSTTVPARVVFTVNVPVFVVVPLIVTLPMVLVAEPLIVLFIPLNVWTPVLAEYVPLLVKLPAKLTVAAPFSVKVPVMVTSAPNASGAAAVSINEPPLFIITAPVNVLVPVAEVIVKLLPATPPPIVVVPDTVKLKAPTLRLDAIVKSLMIKVAQAAFAVIVTLKPPSIVTTSPATGTEAPAAPPVVADQVAVEFQLPLATEKRFAPWTSEIVKNKLNTIKNPSRSFTSFSIEGLLYIEFKYFCCMLLVYWTKFKNG